MQNAGHFTQIAWQDSEALGIGKAIGNVNGVPCTVIVAKYEPAGNTIGKFRENVKPGSFTKAFCNKIDQAVDTPKVENAAVPAVGQGNRESDGSGQDAGQPSAGSEQSPVVSDQGNGQSSGTKENQKVSPTQSVEAGKDDNQQSKPGDSQSSADEFDDVTVGGAEPTVVPEKNKGINPSAAQKHPSKTLKGETKPGAKQSRKDPHSKTAKVVSLGQSQSMPQSTEGIKSSFLDITEAWEEGLILLTLIISSIFVYMIA